MLLSAASLSARKRERACERRSALDALLAMRHCGRSYWLFNWRRNPRRTPLLYESHPVPESVVHLKRAPGSWGRKVEVAQEELGLSSGASCLYGSPSTAGVGQAPPANLSLVVSCESKNSTLSSANVRLHHGAPVREHPARCNDKPSRNCRRQKQIHSGQSQPPEVSNSGQSLR